MHNFRISCTFILLLCVGLQCVDGDKAGKKDCVGQDQCSCQFTDDQSIIDISSLGNSDQTPKFKDITGDDGAIYSYNPCFPFDEGDCSDAAVCMTDTSGEAGTIGSAQSAKFAFEDGTLAVGYTAGSGILTLAQVILKCDKKACEPTLSAEGSKGLGQYELTMTTVCACPNECDENGPKHCGSKGGGGGSAGGLSGGSVILIVFFVLVIFYAVGGVMFMKFKVKAEGKEVIPNYGFWSSIPLLIKPILLETSKPGLVWERVKQDDGGVMFMKFKVKAEGKEVIPNYGFWSSIPSLIKDGVLFTLRPCLKRSTYSSK